MSRMSRKSGLRALGLASILLCPLLALAQSDGRIESPKGQVSAGRMTVKGTHSKMSDGERYWLVVRRGERLWPKVRVRAEPTWEATIDEPAPSGGRFSLVLFAVTPRGDQQLQAWIKSGELANAYEGMPAIPEGQELDAVSLRAG